MRQILMWKHIFSPNFTVITKAVKLGHIFVPILIFLKFQKNSFSWLASDWLHQLKPVTPILCIVQFPYFSGLFGSQLCFILITWERWEACSISALKLLVQKYISWWGFHIWQVMIIQCIQIRWLHWNYSNRYSNRKLFLNLEIM